MCVFFALSLVSCMTFGSEQDSSQIQAAAKGGFSAEVDEPSTRGQLVQVTPDKMNVSYRYSIDKDGTIFFSGKQPQDKVYNIWKITAANMAPTRLTAGTNVDSYTPVLTFDGQSIVYETAGTLWLMRKDGAGGKRKIPGSGLGRDINPDLNKMGTLVFESVTLETDASGNTVANRQIWTSDLNGGNLTQIRSGSRPRWSPDGSKIVFEDNGDLWLINADGTGLLQLTSTSDAIDGLASFNADGSKIVFTSNQVSDNSYVNYNIWVMNSDGTGNEQLTSNPAWDAWPTQIGAAVYFLSGRKNAGEDNFQRIWALSLGSK